MADADYRREYQLEADTRDSLAAMARRKSTSTHTAQDLPDMQDDRIQAGSGLESDVVQTAGAPESPTMPASFENTATTQVLPPSFIPSATGRIRPVPGAFPAVQSDSQEKQSKRGPTVRLVKSLAAGTLRKSERQATQDAEDTAAPRIASSAPHYVD